MTTNINERLAVEVAELRRLGDNAYCAYINDHRKDDCLGITYKMEKGIFTQKNLDALNKAAEQLGKHRAFHEAAKLIEAAINQSPTP